jgi:hypothetical protein
MTQIKWMITDFFYYTEITRNKKKIHEEGVDH